MCEAYGSFNFLVLVPQTEVLEYLAQSTELPKGYSIVKGECGVNALKKVLNNLCTRLSVRSGGSKGSFVLCKGKVVEGSWRGLQGVEAWNALLEDVSRASSEFHLTFYQPPSSLTFTEDLEVATEVALEETEASYFSGVSVVALGKHVLAILHKLESLGYEVEDMKIKVDKKVAYVSLAAREYDPELVRRIALEYLEPLGIKEVRVESLG